jgi:hypothetical protein
MVRTRIVFLHGRQARFPATLAPSGWNRPSLLVFRAGGGLIEPDRRVKVPWGASKSILGYRANLEGDFFFSGVGLELLNSCSWGRASRHRAKGTAFVTDRQHRLHSSTLCGVPEAPNAPEWHGHE